MLVVVSLFHLCHYNSIPTGLRLRVGIQTKMLAILPPTFLSIFIRHIVDLFQLFVLKDATGELGMTSLFFLTKVEEH